MYFGSSMPAGAVSADADGQALCLTDYRIGDKLAVAFAEGLEKLHAQGADPASLLLANNALTSHGATAISRALRHLPNLTLLDLSENRVGLPGSEALAQTLLTHQKLRELRVAKARLGDHAVPLLEAMVQNICIESLDLGQNRLGSAATAKGLQELLMHNSTLKSLKLGWNQLRSYKFEWIATAITENTALTRLDLSWNALGDSGGSLLGSALRLQQTITALDISNNDIGEQGATVVADMLKENKHLVDIQMDSNPIGRRGGRAMLRALRAILLFKIQRKVSLSKCNFEYQSPAKLFDPAEPGGKHSCNLADIHERVVANELVELAWREAGENVMDEKLNGKAYNLPEPPEGVVWTRDDFNLPETGRLSLTYISTKRPPRMEEVIEDRVLKVLIEMMRDKALADRGLGLLLLAAHEWFFSSAQVGQLVTLFKDPHVRIEIVAQLLPRTVDCVNWTHGFLNNLSDKEMRMLETKVGQLFFFIPSNPSGHYHLELAKQHDRIIAKMMVAICIEERRTRLHDAEYASMQWIDTSQCGDGYGFRNAEVNGKPWVFSERKTRRMDVNNLPHHGTLTFDYVSTNVFHRMVDMSPASDEEFEQLLHELHHVEQMVLFGEQSSAKELEPEPEAEVETEAEPAEEEKKEELAAIPASWEGRAQALQDKYTTLTKNEVHLALLEVKGHAGLAKKLCVKLNVQKLEERAHEFEAEQEHHVQEVEEVVDHDVVEAELAYVDAMAETAKNHKAAVNTHDSHQPHWHTEDRDSPHEKKKKKKNKHGKQVAGRRRASIVGVEQRDVDIATSTSHEHMPSHELPGAGGLPGPDGDTTLAGAAAAPVVGKPRRQRKGRRRRSVTMVAYEGGESTSDEEEATKEGYVVKKWQHGRKHNRKCWFIASQNIKLRCHTKVLDQHPPATQLPHNCHSTAT
jgi:Ran GTPase-activating protein (RanGAP) involved in mRNA processing and transport